MQRGHEPVTWRSSSAVTRTRLALIAAAAASTAALTAGCAAGPSAATLQIKPNFAAGEASAIQAQNVVVVVDPETGAAQLTGTVINNGDTQDVLTAVTIGGTQIPLKSSLDVAGKSAVNLAAEKGPKLVIAKKSGLTPGMNADVSLTFATSGTIALSAQSEPNTGIYSQFQPSIGGSSS
jgi:hypothetical protein